MQQNFFRAIASPGRQGGDTGRKYILLINTINYTVIVQKAEAQVHLFHKALQKYFYQIFFPQMKLLFEVLFMA